MSTTHQVLIDVESERFRQLKKWGVQDWSPPEWMMILAEEVGEANKEALEAHFADKFPEHYPEDADRMKRYRKELIEVAAVAVAAIEAIDRCSTSAK